MPMGRVPCGVKVPSGACFGFPRFPMGNIPTKLSPLTKVEDFTGGPESSDLYEVEDCPTRSSIVMVRIVVAYIYTVFIGAASSRNSNSLVIISTARS